MTQSTREHKANSTLKERLDRVYKVVVVDEESLSQSASYRTTLRGYMIIGLALCGLVILGTTAVIAFSPLKRLIPGYGVIEKNQKYLELKDKIAELEEGVEIQETYIKGLRNIFAGEIDKVELLDNQISQTDHTELHATDERSMQVLTDAMRKETSDNKGLNNIYLSSPIHGTISARFDAETGHLGVDIMAAKGTPIQSIAAGVVMNSDWSLNGGHMISVLHDDNVVSVYKHNSSLLKSEGDFVRAGEAIAIIGNTGTLSDGPHLHFELWYEGAPVNPESYITF